MRTALLTSARDFFWTRLLSGPATTIAMTNAVDPNVRYWAELDREVRGLMDGATAEEAELSSDDEGAAEGLLGGEMLSWSRARHSGAVYAEAPRAESRPAAAGDAFRSRLAAAFDALPAPSAIAAGGGAVGAAGDRIGPAFSRQAQGHSLAEPESVSSWHALASREARGEEELAGPSAAGSGRGGGEEEDEEGDIAMLARRAAIAAEDGVGGGEEEEEEGEDDDDDWDAGWDDPDAAGRRKVSRGGGGGGGGDAAASSDDVEIGEWSTHTASWARDADDSDEDDGAAGAGGGAAGAGGGAGGGGAFGGLDDLDELDGGGDDGMDVSSPPPAVAGEKRVRFGDAAAAAPSPSAGARRGAAAAAAAGRREGVAGGSRAGYTHYSLAETEAHGEESNRAGLTQARALLGAAGGADAGAGDGAARGAGAPPAEGGREASFGRRAAGGAGARSRHGGAAPSAGAGPRRRRRSAGAALALDGRR